MMRAARRPIAILAALVVAWTALWPLVSSARALLAGETVMLCHQAGSMVAPDEAPMKDMSGPRKDGQAHCPLCVMAFYGTSFTAPAVPPLQFSTLSVRVDVYSAPSPFDNEVPLPPSRAPPLAAS